MIKRFNATQAAEELVAHSGTFGINTHEKDPVLFGKIIQEIICTLLSSTSHRTMSYSKEENAIVARSNREVLRQLRNFISKIGVLLKSSQNTFH